MAGFGDTVRSPLEQVWRQFIPQGHDQPLRNAFYNVAAAVFVVLAGAAAWSVYVIFQPFVQSLLWAVLCGSVLHPVKYSVTHWLRQWLQQIKSAGSLLSISTAILPLTSLDWLSELTGWFIVAHMRGVVAVTVVLPLVYIVIHHTPTAFTSVAYTLLTSILYIIHYLVNTVTNCHTLVVAVVVIYIVAVTGFWTTETKDVLRRLTIPFWVLFAAALAGLWPSASVPIFIILCLLLIAGLATEVLDVHSVRRELDGAHASMVISIVKVCLGDVDSPQKPAITPQEASDLQSPFGFKLEKVEEEKIEEVDPTKTVGNECEDHKLSQNDDINVEDLTSSMLHDEVQKFHYHLGDEADKQKEESDPHQETSSADFSPILKPKTLFRSTKVEDPLLESTPESSRKTSEDAYQTPSSDSPRPRMLLSPGGSTLIAKTSSPSTLTKTVTNKQNDTEHGNSFMYLKGVFIACVLVELWQHNYLLPLLPLAMFYYFIKKFTSTYFTGGMMNQMTNTTFSNVYSKIEYWAETRRAVLLPLPMRGVIKLLIRTDKKVVIGLLASVDALVTLIIMLAVIMLLFSTSLFLAVQIQGESMQFIAMGSQVINSTIVNNPEFLKMLPAGLDEVLNSTLDNAYIYGREWIAGMVRGMLGETDDARAASLEKQVVELWDRVYQAWIATHPIHPARGPVVTSEAVALTFDNLVDGIRKTPGLVSISFLSEVMKENLGTVVTVLESVWAILISNLSLCLSTLTAASSLLLGGSLSLLNALINMVVFMTALFYILSTSDAVYKPVALFSSLAPGQMNKLGIAVEEAINGVFKASLKMGAFYGMWTWLLHSLFATNLVYIPSVLGALFGAVPLVGTYWAALPGAMELWWGHGSPTQAALLLLAQLLPLSCVDTAIYSDIKGGVHPYLTGLAVAGGVFCWGMEGAIFGPLVLCILLVATNMYATLIQSPSELTRRFQKLRRSHSEMMIS